MLNISGYRISLGKSSYYAQIALLIHACAFLVLANSSWIFACKLIALIFLLQQMWQILHNPRPYPRYSMLSYNKSGWLLHENNKEPKSYENARIVIEAGLFFLFELSQNNQRKYLVIFFDQINEECYRLLNIIQKIK